MGEKRVKRWKITISSDSLNRRMKNPVLPSDNPQRIEALRQYHFYKTITALVTFEIPTENRYNPRTILIANVLRSKFVLQSQNRDLITESKRNKGWQGAGRREYRCWWAHKDDNFDDKRAGRAVNNVGAKRGSPCFHSRHSGEIGALRAARGARKRIVGRLEERGRMVSSRRDRWL